MLILKLFLARSSSCPPLLVGAGGLWGFAAFCFLVAVLAEPLGGGAALGAAVVCTLALQAIIGRVEAVTAARRLLAAQSGRLQP